MKHSIHSALPLLREPRSLSGCPTGFRAFGRRLGLASLVVAAGLLATTFVLPGRAAEADPAPAVGQSARASTAAEGTAAAATTAGKEQFTQLIQAHAMACPWSLEGRVFVGKDLAGKGLELAVSEVKWDDERVYFVVTIAPSAVLQVLLATRKSWTFPMAWGYSRTAGGAGEAPVLKLTEAAGTFPQGTPGPKSTPADWRKIIQKARPVRPF